VAVQLPPDATASVILLEQVTLWRSSGGERRAVLGDVDWRVGHGQHWGVIGPNGAGKSTLLRIASAQIRPSRGRATILGGRLGRVSMPELRRRIGVVEPAISTRFSPEQPVLDVVLTGLSGAIVHADEPDTSARADARRLLRLVGVPDLDARSFTSCSEGERARVLLARALMPEAPLLVLDEPAAGLDLPGREMILRALHDVTRDRPGLTTITVTHHVEELPASTTHLLLLKDGAVLSAGPIGDVATNDAFSECFGLPLRVERSRNRLSVAAVPSYRLRAGSA
jgi:iron complex transport system ATP-binding protein